jgi:hypothetical protein
MSRVFLLIFCVLNHLSRSNGFKSPQQKKLRYDLTRSKISPLNLSPVVQDVAASTLAIGGSAVWLQIWIQLAKSGKIDPKLSRKIIHSGSAPFFMCLWPLYSSGGPATRMIAAAVPLLQTARYRIVHLQYSRCN